MSFGPRGVDPEVLADRLPPQSLVRGLCSTGHICARHVCSRRPVCSRKHRVLPGARAPWPCGCGLWAARPWVAAAHACPRHVHSILWGEEAVGSLPWAGGKRSSDLVSGGVSLPHALLHRLLQAARPPRPGALGLPLLAPCSLGRSSQSSDPGEGLCSLHPSWGRAWAARVSPLPSADPPSVLRGEGTRAMCLPLQTFSGAHCPSRERPSQRSLESGLRGARSRTGTLPRSRQPSSPSSPRRPGCAGRIAQSRSVASSPRPSAEGGPASPA